ncbi:PIN domain-containing protein [Adlercreutzia sp. ZJ138]|uniref:PIN domain-containing protein n=1 Tax=Adlercreutzia sp. ZJ138 TaxID=2709405 RepID=UPI0013EBE6CF|nr:PIN domain-containing protein [Adlercreutzia sp. ZJ138]
MRLLVDTNIVIDCMQCREPFATDARKLLILGALGELELWLSPSQMTDAFYLLSEGGKKSLADTTKARLATVRKLARLCPLGESVIDAALNSPWDDFEDACLYQCARQVKADAIITRNKKDFQRSTIAVLNCAELFSYLHEEKRLVYEETVL